MTAFKTPPVPDQIRSISHPLYRNIYSFGLANQNLWGTETLLGDWDGGYLLVAKDFYPSSYITEAVQSGGRTPYRHNPAAPTNRNLVKTLRHFGRFDASHNNLDCDFLYVSACFLLRNDGLKRGPLPDMQQVLTLSLPVLTFTLDHMPGLKTVVLMGREAEMAFQMGGGASLVTERGLRMFRVSHPSFAMRDVDRFREWETVFS